VTNIAPTTSRGITAKLLKEGWVERDRKGTSHRIFDHKDFGNHIVIPHPKKDFPKGTLRQIYKMAGWT